MKKINLLAMIVVFVTNKSVSQNVGIGTNTPTEKLDVNGAIKIGSTNNTAPGTIRWNAVNNDFEGYNGTKWVSFTISNTSWGTNPVFENYSPHISLNAAGTNLGNALASSGNYVVAGADQDYLPDGSIRAGSIRVLKKVNGVWTPTNTIYNPYPSGNVKFGSCLAMTNNHIIVGTPDHSQGRAYIFQLTDNENGPVISLQALLNDVTNATSGDRIGASVGIFGDIAITGAPNSGSTNTGKVYTYKRNQTLWLAMPPITAFDAAANDHFGHSVGINAQYIAVGAHTADFNGLVNKGKVYIYKLNQLAANWDYITTLTSPGSDDSTYFGRSIYMRGDTLLVNSGEVFGSTIPKVYLYRNINGNWTLQDSIVSPQGLNANDSFGYAMHIEDNKIVIGIPNSKVNGIADKGRALVYVYDGTKWNQAATLLSSGNEEYQFFGRAVLINNNEILIGAPGADLSTLGGFTRESNGKIFSYTQ